MRSESGPRLETVATGLEAPWELAFLPDGRALLTERPGRVRLLSRDLRLQPKPVARVDVAAIEEGGLLGLAVDPQFERNRFVYLYRTTNDGNEVARYRFEGGRLEEAAVLLRGIEAAPIHDAGRIHFGPDGRLYVPTGDAGQDSLAQDRGSLNGKVLRMGPEQYRGEGGRPEVFSLGHRNPQGFDWEPRTGRLYASEHGPDGDDEMNLLRRGANYGWPEAQGEDHDGFAAPLAVYTPAIAPSGATFVSKPGSAWSGDFLVGCLIGEQVRRLSFDGSRVTRNEALFEGDFGRIRTVVEGPDGALYLLTSNRDGRGTPREGDDRVLRVLPPAD
ncbi:MAG TPA: PQQ-dependent sugar dehydrogenase [Thermoleophilaceae bacterium]|nr:PQQ-dependent sugar dehydrogenase [Thermoleophilaceae bacterium]